MDQELRELYQQVILDHNKSPRNYNEMEDRTQEAEGYNPLCGDILHVYLKVEDNIVKDVSFQGSGCAISKASASLMTSIIKGKTKEEAEIIFKDFHDLITGKFGENSDENNLGKLNVFAGVKEFPVRVKCASLAWHTMRSALNKEDKKVTTE
ncbi:MAG: SUF system NifU family Fe-S cluster assembly protein [Bacteroidetes bacterium]|nr:SUF system NifU family Fe-S cluster assembly protein [Bacteroidota bacterium]